MVDVFTPLLPPPHTYGFQKFLYEALGKSNPSIEIRKLNFYTRKLNSKQVRQWQTLTDLLSGFKWFKGKGKI